MHTWTLVFNHYLLATSNTLTATNVVKTCFDKRLQIGYQETTILGSVVRKMDSAIHWIVIFYPVLKML